MDDVEHLWPFRPCNVQWRWGQGTGKEGSCQVEFQSICGSCQNPGILYHAVDAKPTKLSPFPICFVNVFTPAGRMRYARTYSIILLLCFFVVVFCLHALYFFGLEVLRVADSVVESNLLFFSDHGGRCRRSFNEGEVVELMEQWSSPSFLHFLFPSLF